MSQVFSPSAKNGTRLISLLADVVDNDTELSHGQFAGKLARLIDMSDSIRLSEAHGRMKRVTECKGENASGVVDLFIETRDAIVKTVVDSFSQERHPLSITWPELNEDYEPYLRFYQAHQRSFEFKVQQLQAMIRERLTAISPDLAKLVILDEVLADTLYGRAKRNFAAIPHLLGRRFAQLKVSHSTIDAVMNRFAVEVKSLLLAELEVRFLPVSGLVEAVNEQETKK